MSNNIVVSTPPANELFKSEVCNIGNGAVIIDLKTCNVTINPTLTIESAAKLSAKQIYQVMEHPNPITQEPEWVNSVKFSDDENINRPAIAVYDDKLYYNSPPFNKTRKNLAFWRYFAKYWYVMVVKAMVKALSCRKDISVKEQRIMDRYSKVDV